MPLSVEEPWIKKGENQEDWKMEKWYKALTWVSEFIVYLLRSPEKRALENDSVFESTQDKSEHHEQRVWSKIILI